MAAAQEYAAWIVQNQSKRGTPEFNTVAQAYEMAKQQENVGATQAQIRTPEPETGGIARQLVGAGETALTLGTGIVGGTFGIIGGGLTGLLEQVKAGKFGTKEAADAIEKSMLAGAQRYTYMPTTPEGQEQVQAIGKLGEMFPAIVPTITAPGAVVQAVRQAAPIVEATALRTGAAAQQAARTSAVPFQRGAQAIREGLGFETEVPTAIGGRASGGAAATSMELQRMTTAEGLKVPVTLTKGAAGRDAEQLAFEKEQMRGPLGAPLRQRAEENNLQILQNFDALVDETGAADAMAGPYASGNKAIDALSKGFKEAKGLTKAAYTRAGQSQGALEPVDLTKKVIFGDADNQQTTSLIDYLNSRPQGLPSSNIPDTVKTFAVQLGIAKRDENGILNALPANVKQTEQLRRELNRATGYDPVDIRESSVIKNIIDGTIGDSGGDLYKKARSLREEQARKYENRAIVANLVTKRKGMDDPKIEASKVFDRSIVKASPEEITFLKRVLITSGEDGRQAWKELQGATIKHIEGLATQGMQTDSSGRPIVSVAKLNQAVNALDANNRLDIVLGKEKAQMIRDLNEVAKYVNTVPPGTLINNSGTAGALMAAMGEAGATAALTGLPLPVISILRAANMQMKNNKTKAKIMASLNRAEKAAAINKARTEP